MHLSGQVSGENVTIYNGIQATDQAPPDRSLDSFIDDLHFDGHTRAVHAGFKSVDGLLQRECMGDEFRDVSKDSSQDQSDHHWPRKGISERGDDVDLAETHAHQGK